MRDLRMSILLGLELLLLFLHLQPLPHLQLLFLHPLQSHLPLVLQIHLSFKSAHQERVQATKLFIGYQLLENVQTYDPMINNICISVYIEGSSFQ